MAAGIYDTYDVDLAWSDPVDPEIPDEQVELPDLRPFRKAGWQDAAECYSCGALGKDGVQHLGCDGMFTIVYE